MTDTIQKIAGDMLALAELLHDPSPEKKRLRALAERLTALSARASAGEGGRERDREMFSDAGFNRWLDEYVSDTGHTVYDYIGGHEMIAAAWGGWDAYRYYHSHAPQPAQAGASGGGEVACFRFRPKGEPHFSRWQDGPPPKFSADVEVECAYSRTTPASPATGATLGVEGQMRLVAELANDMDEAHRAEQCTEFAKRLRAIFAPNWQTGAAHPQQAPVPVRIDCPQCTAPHVDEGEWATRPHKTHQCQACGHEWRPFPYATVGTPPAQATVKESLTVHPAHGDGEAAFVAKHHGDYWTVQVLCGEEPRTYVIRKADGALFELPDDRVPFVTFPATRPTPEAREYRLFDSQWVNVVNHAGCYRDMNKEDAVAQAVKLTEQAMAANINDCKWPRPRKADAALALPAQGEGNNG